MRTDWLSPLPAEARAAESSALGPSAHHYFKCDSFESWTHLRVNIYPDGGIARLKAYGVPELDEAKSKGKQPLAYARQVAEVWQSGLASHHQESSRVEKFAAIDKTIYTPGSSAGIHRNPSARSVERAAAPSASSSTRRAASSTPPWRPPAPRPPCSRPARRCRRPTETGLEESDAYPHLRCHAGGGLTGPGPDAGPGGIETLGTNDHLHPVAGRKAAFVFGKEDVAGFDPDIDMMVVHVDDFALDKIGVTQKIGHKMIDRFVVDLLGLSFLLFAPIFHNENLV